MSPIVVGNLRNVIRRAPSGSRVVLHPTAEHLAVEVIGDLDGPTTRDLASILACALGRGGRAVHLDLSQTSYIGLGAADALAAAAAAADRLGGHVTVVKASRPARRCLEEAGLASMLGADLRPVVIDITTATPPEPAPVADEPIAQTG